MADIDIEKSNSDRNIRYFTKVQRYQPIISVGYTDGNINTVTVFISYLIHEVHIT